MIFLNIFIAPSSEMHPMSDAALQAQIDALKLEVSSLRQILDQTQKALEDSRKESTILRQKLDALARRYFGKKSEQLDSAQLMLLLNGISDTVVEAPASKAKQLPLIFPRKESAAKTQRIRVPDNLEVVTEVIEPEVVQAQPGQWKQISQEVSRLLDYQPGKFFWKETIRPKYVRAEEKLLPPVIAPAPVRVADHGMAAAGLLAYLLVSKFADHLPFYRLQMIFWQRHGVFIARAQMVMWTRQCVVLLEAIVVCIKKEVQTSGYVQVDETPVRYMDPENPGRCSQGYLWTALVPKKCVLYEWHASRAATCLESLLGPGYAGKIQCDGYSAYPAFAKNRKVTLFGCMAHLRRGFFEAKDQTPSVVGWILNQIGILYGWEEDLRNSRAGPGFRESIRASHSRMVVERLGRVLQKLQSRYLPRSPMGEAISYALNQWEAVSRFVDHGEVEIDDNLVENAIRPTCVGKKNWMFFGSEEAGVRNAAVFTLIQNCRMHGIEPYAYLKDVLERLPTTTNKHVAELTPLNWKLARVSEKARQAA
jgi:transposase